MNQLIYLYKLSKNSSLSTSEEEKGVNITFLICDPLVKKKSDVLYPLFQD